jgi:cytochrome bd ubiquinol oxidase subunit II
MITLWFSLVVLCWVLFFVLEGFDFGVGVLSPVLGRDDHERGAIVRTVGPFWDGNEVWLVAAIGVTFAAFPAWYAALLSALYLPMALILLLLAVRGVALEFRGKGDGPAWRRRCDRALAASSAGIVLLWGAVLGILTNGLALGADGQVTGAGLSRSLSPLLSWPALAGAVLALLTALLLGAAFLALRTTGPVHTRARQWTVRLAAALAAGLVVAGLLTGSRLILAAAVVAVGITLVARAGRELIAFVLSAAAVTGATVALFTRHGEVVLRSTLDPAWSLTMRGAAAGTASLQLITIAGAIILPGVVAYQIWSYWVFRKRVASERVAS